MTPYQLAEKWGQLHSKLQDATKLALQQTRLHDIREKLTKALEMLAELEAATPVEITVSVPRCWKDLVDVDFDNAEMIYEGQPVLDAESNRVDDGDSAPYYDDHRTRQGKNAEGWLAEVHICSGQSNYWGEIHIYAPDGECIIESSAWEAFADANDLEQDDTGRKFVVKIVWE